MLVEQHRKNERERVAAEQLVGARVLGDAELRHPGGVPYGDAWHIPDAVE